MHLQSTSNARTPSALSVTLGAWLFACSAGESGVSFRTSSIGGSAGDSGDANGASGGSGGNGGRMTSNSATASGGSGVTTQGNIGGSGGALVTGAGGEAGLAGNAGQNSGGGTGGNGTGGVGGLGGVSGTGGAGTGGALAGGTGGQSSGTGGSGGQTSGGAGGQCSELPPCESVGSTCDGNTVVTCALDENDCLTETRLDCGAEICAEADGAACQPNGSGDSCSDVRVVPPEFRVTGQSFGDDYGNQHHFTGAGCAETRASAAEAVFEVSVPAGSTLSITDGGSIDAAFGIMGSCSDDAACLTSANINDSFGISYTAQEDRTVFVWVSSFYTLNGSYDVRLTLPATIGTFEAYDMIPRVEGGPLAAGTSEVRVIHFSEDVIVNGGLNALSGGDLDLYVTDAFGRQPASLYDYGDEALENVWMPAGTYRFSIYAYSGVDGYALDLATDYAETLPTVGLTTPFMSSIGRQIPEGRSQFYLMELDAAGIVTIAAAATSGDPDIRLYEANGFVLVDEALSTGTSESASEAVAAGSYWVEVQAEESSGSIDGYSFSVSLSE